MGMMAQQTLSDPAEKMRRGLLSRVLYTKATRSASASRQGWGAPFYPVVD